ncbi:MAG: PAS domain S-box protein, partial [Rhodospirillales bacterium]|nr:PAS domain S-box protein [Rhodospirillales bacterium]
RKLKLEMREREESERALKLSEKGLANAQRIAKLGSWKYDIKNKTSKRSEEFYRIMGQDPKQGDPLFEDNINLTHPEDRDKVKAAFDACMSTFAPYDVEHRVIRPDGEMRHVHKRGEITFDKDGNPEFLDGTMLDVTERKLAEERLSDAIESINEGFALYDSKDRLVLFNSKYRETFPEIREKIVPGVTYEELLWHSVNCGVYPEEIDRKKEFIHERVKRHQLGNDSLEIKLSNNRWILLSDRTTKGGEIVGVRTDITELKIREEALRESEARLDAFFTEAPAGLVLFDKNLRYVKINKMLAETAGISAEEHIGKSFSEVVPEIAENVTPIMMKILETGKPVINLETRNKSGKSPEETQWWNSSLFPIFGTDGTPTGIGAVSSDITAIKKAEINILNLNANLEKRVEIRTQELKEAKERAEEASSAKSSFLSNMSHELRTPMNAILGFGQLMELGSDNILSPKQKEYLDHILSSGNHLLELINEVLDLAKIESDTSSLSISEVLPMDVFRNCATQIHPIAEKYGITDINITCMGALPEIYADEIRLKQVMMNLLSNAAKYNTPGGSITCDCEKTNGGMLRFSITDTGMGIPDDRRDELFQPFNRLNAENSGIEGTGVGLTITKKLVELMGGAVGYDSVYGEGSTFWFELPLTEKGKKQEIEIVHKDFAFESETNHSGARTLLYIEDNPANLRLMEEVIEKVSDIEMISAHTAELGLEIAQTMKPDIIILDIMLPGLNGFDALKRLQNSKSVNHVPVLALSANAMKTDIEKGMEAGFFAYLTKPINIRKTVNVIREALGDEPENVVAIPIKG